MAAGYAKGRATGYTDYFKGKDKTPGSWDDEEDSEVKPKTMVDKRKAALQRRLAKTRKAG